MFGAVTRAVELGIPTDGNRIREFVTGVLDDAGLPVSRATAAIGINAGRARFSDVVIKSAAADLQATASVDLADGTLDALLTLTDVPAPAGAPPPSVLVALKGPLLAPERAVDTGLLTSWLTLRAVERHSKQIDAMEKAGREASAPKSAKPAEPVRGGPPAAQPPISGVTAPLPLAASPDSTGALPAAGQAPALPPPVDIPTRANPGAVMRPPGLVGAQR